MAVRDEAHRVLDAAPREPGDLPRRRFRTTAIFDGESDLAARSKEIVRNAWASEEPRSA